MNCDQKGQIAGIVGGGTVVIHSSGQTNFNSSYIEGSTPGADDFAGRAIDMGVDRIGEVSVRASDGQAAGVYVTGLTAGSLIRVGVWVGTREPRTQVGSDKELTEVRMVAEGV